MTTTSLPSATLPMAPAAPSTGRPHGRRMATIGLTVVLAIVGVFWLAPLLLLITTAMRPLSDFVAHGPLTWPSRYTGSNFAQAWQIGNFAATYRNSAIITAVKVPIGVFVSALLAYALAKLNMPFRRPLMFIIFFGLTIPIYIAILPNFITLRQLGLTNNIFGLLGPYLAFGIPFEVLILQSFFRAVPREIIEAAKVDGAGSLRIFFTIMVPLSLPVLITVAILDAVSTWNEFLMALIILNSDNSKTIPVGLLNFMGQFSNNDTGLAAGILIAVVPILILYILLQRYIISGLTAGAMKG